MQDSPATMTPARAPPGAGDPPKKEQQPPHPPSAAASPSPHTPAAALPPTPAARAASPPTTTTTVLLTVPEALAAMQACVRSGRMDEAARIGETTVPGLSLSLSPPRLAVDAAPLSAGAESTVHRGLLLLQATSTAGEAATPPTPVAVKRYRISQADDLERFRRELAALAAVRSPFVTPLLGACALPPNYSLVLPLAPLGDAADLVHQRGWRPDWRVVAALGRDLAAGLGAVHEQGILHRDVKPANVLVLGFEGEGASAEAAPPPPRARVRAQLGDFGLACTPGQAAALSAPTEASVRARGKPTGGFHRRAAMGTLEYMAPELLSPYRASPEGKKKNDGGDGNSSDGNGSSGGNGGRASATPASDVFALAVALNELLTATPPYSDCTKAGEPEAHTVLEAGYGRMELAAAVCSAGLRPTLPGEGARAGEGGGALTAAVEAARASLAAGGGGGEGALGPLMLPPPEYVLLMAACWAADPSERPSAAEASRAFEAMLGKYPRVSLEQQEQQGAAVGPQTSGQLLPKEEPVSDEARAAARLAPLVAAGAAAAAAARAAADRQEHEDDDPLAALLRRQGLVVSSSSSSKISSGAFETIGPREGMEDRHVVASSGGGGGGGGSGGSPSSSPAWHLAAVLDGHRGAECADSAARALPRALKGAAAAALAEFSQQQQEQASTATAPSAAPVVCVSAADPLDDPVAAALAASFLAADARFLLDWQAGEVGRKLAGAAGGQASAAPPAPPRCPGATALALLAVQGGRRLYVANAGDSRAFLFVPPTSPNGTTQIYPLSRDHAASSAPDEAARVAAAGGRVAAGGRIGDAALAVTRALGDWDLKGPAAVGAAVEAAGAGGHEGEQKQQLAAALDRGPGNRGLTALPEVRCVSFGGGDANPPPGAFAVLATDGVWDTLPPEDAAALVRDTAKDPRMCAQRLVGESALRGSRDNATALVVFLSSSGALEVVWASDRDGAAVPASAPTAYGTRSTCLLEDNDVEMRD